MTKTSKQEGLAPIAIVIAVAVVLVIGAVGWFVLSRNDDSESASSTETTDTTEETEETSDGSFSGSYLDAIDRGKPLECQWRLPEELAKEYQAGQGKFYTDGQNRGYSEATFKTDGTETTAYAIFDTDYVYGWTKVPGAGMVGTKLPLSTIESSGEDLSETEKQQGMDFRAKYSFSCQPWTVDESLLTPPSDVTFTEINLP